MKYEGKLYGKVSGKYVELKSDTSDISALRAENAKLRDALSQVSRNVKYVASSYVISEEDVDLISYIINSTKPA